MKKRECKDCEGRKGIWWRVVCLVCRVMCLSAAGATPPPYLWSEWTDWATCCYEEGYDSRYKEKKRGEKTRFRDCVLEKCKGKKSLRESVSECIPESGNGDKSGGFPFCPGKTLELSQCWSTKRLVN